MDLTLTILLGISTSFLASILFLLALSRLRPDVVLSDTIARTVDQGQHSFRIKCVNRSRRACIDVRAELLLITPVNVEGGQIRKTRVLKLKRDRLFQLGRFDLNDKDYKYDFRFVCEEDIDTLLDDSSPNYLQMSVMTTDAVSGRTTVVSKRFHYKKAQVKEGSFPIGLCLDVR